jgi:hypothetical protein
MNKLKIPAMLEKKSSKLHFKGDARNTTTNIVIAGTTSAPLSFYRGQKRGL